MMNVRSLSVIVAALVAAILSAVAPQATRAAGVGATVTSGMEVGRDRYDAAWRSIVSLQMSYAVLPFPQLASHGCAGVLIRPTIVLTAAHCTERGVSSGAGTRALGGTRRLAKTTKRTYGASVRVVETIAYPGSVTSTYGGPPPLTFDLALLRLAEPIPGAVPIAVIDASEDAAWGAGSGLASGAYIAGWGRTRGYGSGRYVSTDPRDLVAALTAKLEHDEESPTNPDGSPVNPEVLREVAVPIVPDRRCASTDSPMGEGAPDFERRTMLCIGRADTKAGQESDRIGACYGDSGGPLVVPVADGSLRLVGITSWGRDSGCNGLTAYARVATARDWIDATIRELETPSTTVVAGAVTGELVDADTLRLRWPAVSGPYERLSIVEERSAYDEYFGGPFTSGSERLGPRIKRALRRTTVRRTLGLTGEGSTSFTVEDVRPRRSSAATSAYRVVATLASGRKVFGPRSFVRMPVDDVAPTAPGLVRRVGSYRGLVGLLRWGSSTDDQCVAGYMLEVRWPAWKPGIWEAQHAERTRGCGGASEGESWFEDLAPTTTPTFDLRRGTWLVRAVAVDHAGNRGVGPVSRIRIPAYVEDLGLESECRLVGPNVVCTYPKDDY
jgi:hypothetical protein